MTLWAFVLSTIYVPGLTGAGIQTGWAFLSITLPFMIWGRVEVTLPHLLLLAFCIYATASLLWAPNFYFGIFSLWQLACAAGAFVLGSQMRSLRPVALGLAFGLSVSSVIATMQYFELKPVESWTVNPTGLFYNSWVLGGAACLTILLLYDCRLWWPMLLVAPALWLSYARSAMFATALPILFRLKYGWAIIPLAIGSILMIFYNSHYDDVRIAVWQGFLAHLTPRGAGVGAVDSLTMFLGNGQPLSAEHAHNEFLDLAYHYGIFAAIPISVALALASKPSRTWMGFLLLASFGFPLHSPVTAFIGALCAGHLARDWRMARLDSVYSRPRLVYRGADA